MLAQLSVIFWVVQAVVSHSQAITVSGVTVEAPNSAQAACCSLQVTSPTQEVHLVAGLPYLLGLHAASGVLGGDATSARLLLVLSVMENGDCPSQAVLDFGGAYSALDGLRPAYRALTTTSEWLEARVPYNGSYGLCYRANVSDAEGWSAVPNVTLHAFGAAKPALPRFLCSAEPGAACAVPLAQAAASSRLRLAQESAVCGQPGGAPYQEPFDQSISTPLLEGDVTWHRLGRAQAQPADSPSFLICFCDGFELDVSSDGSGHCRSSGVEDFPQALGTLQLLRVVSQPDRVFTGQPFTLDIRCNVSSSAGCSGLPTARIRLIEAGEDGSFGEAGPSDRCRFGAETSLQVPANCGPGGLTSGVAPFSCQLKPVVATTAGWRWALELRPRRRGRASLPTALGVCFCDGLGESGCSSGANWLRVGSLTAEPLLLLPLQRLAGEVQDLRLEAPGGRFDTAAQHILKLIADDAGTLQESSCASALPEPERVSLRCSAEGCPSADQVAEEVLTWQRLEVSFPGWYAACYCQVSNATAGCEDGSWQLLGWQLAAGVSTLTAGSSGTSPVVYRGGHFLLSLRGAGFTPEDRLHIQAGEVACVPWADYQATAGTAPVALAAGASEEPILPGSLAPGELRSFSREGIRGRLSLTRAHGLQAGDTLRFSDLLVVGPACGSVFSPALGRNISDCLEMLEAGPINVFSTPSETEVVLEVSLSEEELQSLDLSLATWAGASSAAFGRFAAGREAAGRHAVCWGRRDGNFSASVSFLEVVDAPPFPSALHLTTALPHVPAPSVLAFQTNGAAPYSEAGGPMRLALTFRTSSPLRHSFSPADESVATSVSYDQAAQEVCGRLFRELWSEDEDGFPQPAGCYYSDELAEYGIVFPARAGLKPGTRYQMVMTTELQRGISAEHDWMILSDMVPLPAIAPQETRDTNPQSFGDLGPLPSLRACQEACALVLQCNAAVYRLASDQHCLIADFSQRSDPFATQGAEGNFTLFLADRINGTASDSRSVVADLWSMDDMLSRPFHAVEASETVLAARAAAAVLPSDPRWHSEGLMVLDPDGFVTEEAAPLLLTQPRLALRLRAAQGSSIEAGTLLRLFLRPLTQWALPEEGCPAQCVPQSVVLSCDSPACHAVALVSAPWEGQRNVLEIVLPPNMDKITDTVMHSIVLGGLSGSSFALPAGGFMPSRLSAEIVAPTTEAAAERRVSYMESVGVLPYTALAVVGGVLARDGDERPFAGDVSNSIYFRFKLGSTLLSGSLLAALTVQLPAGYIVRSANVAPSDLLTLSSRRLSGPQSRGQLTAGTWSCATRTCTFTMDSHAAIYSGYLVVHFVVDNPSIPLRLQDTANRWSVAVSGQGDAATLAVLPATMLDPGSIPSEQALYTPASAVLGRLSEISLTPTTFWQGSTRSWARIFFRTQQGWPGRVALQLTASSSGFGFDATCSVEDLPAAYYRPEQSILGQSSSAEQGAQQATVRRLPKVEACQGVHVSSLQPSESNWLSDFYAPPGRLPSLMEIFAAGPLLESTTYAFAMLVRHGNSFQASEGAGFVLATYIRTETSWQLLDRSPGAMPLLPATAGETWPGYGLYELAAPDALHAVVVPRLPFAQTAQPGEAQILLRPPVTSAFRGISWRVFAPTNYGWDFTDRGFFFRQSEVPGATADLPVIRAPAAPRIPPLNSLIFYGADENPTPGWVVNETYGFRAGLQVPTQTTRHAVNEWIVEWGFDQSDLSDRLAAAVAPAEEVRAVHSFRVWSLGGSIRGQSGELLVEFGLVSEVPSVRGALQLRTPQGFVFESICVPFPPSGSFDPFLPLPVRVECAAATAGTADQEPLLTIRPMDGSLPPGRWCFLLTCFLPSQVTAADASPVFILRTFASLGVEAIDQLADVGASTAGFRTGQRMPFVGILADVDYRLSGRDDHPGRASTLIFAFELRTAPNVIGNVHLEVVAPLGYLFNDDCVADISDQIFGTGQGFPSPYRPFEPGVLLVGCAGHRNIVQLEVTPGLLPGNRYAFALRVDEQPAATPVQNTWFLNVADQASEAIDGYPLWAFTDLALGLLLETVMAHSATIENEVTILFRPTNTMMSQGALQVTAPEGFRIRRSCAASVQQLASGSGLAQTPADVELPGVVCDGERPATNRFEVTFVSQLSLVAGGVRYRLKVSVLNPSTLSPTPGSWALQSYQEGLLDVGTLASPALSAALQSFEVFPPTQVASTAQELPITAALDLQDLMLGPGDTLMVTAPVSFDFAVPVPDASLEADLRNCRDFRDLSAEVLHLGSLPRPRCAGNMIQFTFLSRPVAGSFRFRAISAWPTQTALAGQDAFVASLHTADPLTGQARTVSGRAPLQTAVAPRFGDFLLQRTSGIRADAVFSVGDIQIIFRPRQSAQALSLDSRLQEDPGLGIDLSSADLEVTDGPQLIKEVLLLRPAVSRLALAADFAAGRLFGLRLRNVKNPEVPGSVLWTLRSFSRPRLRGSLVTAAEAAAGAAVAAAAGGQALASASATAAESPPPHEAAASEVLQWLDWTTQGRDEIAELEATPVRGLLQILPNSPFLESSFFDFPDTEVAFSMGVLPGQADVGQRFLIFAPDDWQLIPDSFVPIPNFPEVQDLGVLHCWHEAPPFVQPVFVRKPVYVLRLLNDLLGTIPCRFNPAQMCENIVSFRFRATTPASPVDLARWRAESNQAWLLQVDSHAGAGCGPDADRLSAELVRFTNDAHFTGFLLKESLFMQVVPEPHGNIPRRASILEVRFRSQNTLRSQGSGIFVRLEAPLGVEFALGCLAAVPDPDYVGCEGVGRLAVAQRAQATLETGQHTLVLRAVNPIRTPSSNWWTLQTFANVTAAAARLGEFPDVRQRGRVMGFQLAQTLQATIQPSSPEAEGSVQLFLWLRPASYVPAGGRVEIHAGQAFELSCTPSFVLLSMPPGTCEALHATSGLEYTDDHDVVMFRIAEGHFLLPNNEYELSIFGRNARTLEGVVSTRWGVLLRDDRRDVLEANMEIPSYSLTAVGMQALSLQPSVSVPYARNEVRLQLGFQQKLSLAAISEVRIDAPNGWDFRPICNLYLDVTGGCENRCSFQLPYSEERGHHICPEANVLLLLLDQSAVIEEGVFVLLLGVINPAAAPSQNLWKISLINSAAATGDPGSDKVTTLLIPGFFVGFRQSLQLPAVPLTDEVFQALTSGFRQPPCILAAAASVALACCRGRMP